MARRTIVAGNWKMHTDAASAAELVESLASWSTSGPGPVEMIVAPPFPFLADVVKRIAGGHQGGTQATITVAAQNCHEAEQGAYTGDVSVPMLRSVGVGACIVGHSERRQYHGETDEAVGRKVVALLKHGLTPIYCCGERLEEREEGRHFEVVAAQVREALGRLDGAGLEKVVVAYEPVWAIGTGLTATPDQAQEMHAFIRGELGKIGGDRAQHVPILYGGSCKPSNAEGLFAGADIDGGLIGGASLSADDFIALVRIAKQVKAGTR